MQVECAAAVVEMLAVEANESECVCVIDEDVGHVFEIATRAYPSFAQVAVFRSRERERLVEAAELQELRAWDREIVRREEPSRRRVLSEVVVEEIDDPLARRRVDVVREDV